VHTSRVRCLLVFLCCVVGGVAGRLAAVEVTLASPLTTVVPLDTTVTGPRVVTVRIQVPEGGPADLGLGVVVRDPNGRWFQRAASGALVAGEQVMTFRIDSTDFAEAHPLPARLGPADLEFCNQTAVFLWSAAANRSVIQVEAQVEPIPPTLPDAELRDMKLPGWNIAQNNCHVRSGERWELSVTPAPFPVNPFDPDAFTLSAQIIGPDGAYTIAGFATQEVVLQDRGDRQRAERRGDMRYALRFRPPTAGRYAIRLTGTWADGSTCSAELPPLIAEGPPSAPVVAVDATDPRFFQLNGKLWWPIGLNLHSTFDLRSREVLATTLTPPRGTLVYDALFPRLAAAGIDACEIWLSSWNLALEWRADWPEYEGIGRYNLGNAARLDAVLDAAWTHGIRVNLVINNHGQASAKTDKEWNDSPWNTDNGGPLDQAADIFTDPRSLVAQDHLRRYIIARYADHPAILGWKLWSEVNLTAGKGEPLIQWFADASARWRALDPYHHLCAPHWSGSYRNVTSGIAALDDLGYLCIDAYRGIDRTGSQWQSIAALMGDSIHDASRGLKRWHKPVLTTEYGLSGKGPEQVRRIDLRLAGFSALVSGHAGAPMTWWWEWVDQKELWADFIALRRFITGEDLRGGRSVEMSARGGPGTAYWCRAWVHPGRMLGYVVDSVYAGTGVTRPVASVDILLGDAIAAGSLRLQWVDADTGLTLEQVDIEHPGGPLHLATPAFTHHLAWKLWRPDAEPAAPSSEMSSEISGEQ